jgi:gamma-glutamyltranspeptidase/glutathione hydrolase
MFATCSGRSKMFTTRPELMGTHGMVASTHWLASGTAMAVLEAGGNAFDAVVAAGFVLQVVEPHMNGPGGDMSLMYASALERGPVVLCGQGPAPAAATAAHYRSLGLDLVPGAGLLAAAVPGATPAWLTLLRDHGTRSLRETLRYAIEYAGGGYPLVRRIVDHIASVERLFRDEWATSAQVYLPGGRLPGAGTMFTNRSLAATYERLVREGEARGQDRQAQVDGALHAWSEGFVADEVDAFARNAYWDSSGGRHPGVITGADLAGWDPPYEEPARLDYRGLTVCKTPAWGQGPVLLQQLALLDGFDLAPGVGPRADAGDDAAGGAKAAAATAEFVHTVVECAKLAFADREAWYGDTLGVPLASLLAPGYADRRRALVGPHASPGLTPGTPDGRASARLPRLVTEPLAPGPGRPDAPEGDPTVTRTGDTCHIDVVDRWGNMVSATPSGGWLMSSPIIPALGFSLGTRAQMFWLEEGLPTTLTPGRRPRTTLSPTLALRDGEPVLAFGTPGGDQQDQWQTAFLLRHLLGGVGLQAAIDAPTFHTNHFPSSFYPRTAIPGQVVVESRIGHDVVAALRARGHDVHVAGPWSLGRLCAVSRDPATGMLRAAADPRRMQGYAVGR